MDTVLTLNINFDPDYKNTKNRNSLKQIDLNQQAAYVKTAQAIFATQLKIVYQNASYQLIDGDSLLNLMDGDCICHKGFSITVEITQKEKESAVLEINNKAFSNEQMYQNNSANHYLAKENTKHLFDNIIEVTGADNPLAFLNQAIALDKALDLSKNNLLANTLDNLADNNKNKMKLMNEYFKAPITNNIKPTNGTNYSYQEQNGQQQGNILRDLGLTHDSYEQKPKLNLDYLPVPGSNLPPAKAPVTFKKLIHNLIKRG